MTPEKAKILLIDDDPLVLTSLRELLKRTGYAVTSAASPSEALDRVRESEFDLIISDVRMPGENGIDLVTKIKDFQRNNERQSVFIFITGYADEDAPQYAAQLGIPEFLHRRSR